MLSFFFQIRDDKTAVLIYARAHLTLCTHRPLGDTQCRKPIFDVYLTVIILFDTFPAIPHTL